MRNCLQVKYDQHMKDKIETRDERDKDWKLVEDTKAVICFDLKNVITCPRANISNFLYKRKLNVYNLTAHCAISKKKTAYPAVWPERVAGRGGNEIVSALLAFLDSVVKNNSFAEYDFMVWFLCCPKQKFTDEACIRPTGLNNYKIFSMWLWILSTSWIAECPGVQNFCSICLMQVLTSIIFFRAKLIAIENTGLEHWLFSFCCWICKSMKWFIWYEYFTKGFIKFSLIYSF